MNEVEELSKLDIKNLPPLKKLLLDNLYQNVLSHLHIELGAGPVLYLLSPSFSVINPSANETISDFIQKKENILSYIKEYVIQNLTVYSVLLDVNSYFIEQNNFLVLARLRERDSDGRRYEIKFYTHSPRELMTQYQDKIYIGRDFIDLYQFKRKYLGAKELINSCKEQYDMLLDKAEEKLKKPLVYKSFFQEIKEYVNELHTESLEILQSLPPYLDYGKLSGEDLIDINSQYRSINHYMIELRDEVAEFENLLRFKKEMDFVRYVTKYKKDLANDISYFNIKINGCLQNKIYNWKNKS
jgi:outer membrane lipoprotein-sorting protein